ncbi:putative organic hydroperoxide resistance protein [Rhodococcus gordoniae]|nr:Organic hydroperoxide resistance protein OhrB [Rhodococcus sp. B50]SUE17127.1 putative organic hydroperoxide resistance protein [Rhodococcus gordoniae]
MTVMEYTAEATADGNGRNGRVASNDGLVDVALGIPVELGGAGGGSNPEQLFAAGYAGCFLSALSSVARVHKVRLTDPTVTARVTIADHGEGFGLSVELVVNMPGVDEDVARTVVEGAHQKCPYSKAVRNNVDVALTLK